VIFLATHKKPLHKATLHPTEPISPLYPRQLCIASCVASSLSMVPIMPSLFRWVRSWIRSPFRQPFVQSILSRKRKLSTPVEPRFTTFWTI